jgi:catechol 2,3-dioxygenase-like lactoylglutathione lyase family enzyme
MMKLGHLAIPVSDVRRSRDCYVATLGVMVEFEVAERNLVALQDSDGFALFLQQVPGAVQPGGCALWFQVEDVEATFAEWHGRGIAFAHGPQKSYCGDGVELVDPDGYLIRLWDARSMKAPGWCLAYC